MDHQQALDAQLPERYVFRELRDVERDQFEEHLADCSRCLEQVAVAQSFAANTRAVFRDQAQAAPANSDAAKSDRLGWGPLRRMLAFSGGLNLALGAVALYAFAALIPLLRTEIEALRKPSVSESYVIHGASRGSPSVYPVHADAAANFRLDLPRRFDRFRCVITGEANRPEKAYNLPGAGNSESLNVTIPVAALPPGDYRIRLSGLLGSESELLADFVLRVTSGQLK